MCPLTRCNWLVTFPVALNQGATMPARRKMDLETAVNLQVWQQEQDRKTLAEVLARLTTTAARN